MDNYSWVPWVISALLLLFSAATYFRNGKKESDEAIRKEDAKFDAIKENNLKMNLKLDQLCSNTNSILIKFEKHESDIQNLKTEFAVMGRDLKTAFNQIDELKKGRGNNEKVD